MGPRWKRDWLRRRVPQRERPWDCRGRGPLASTSGLFPAESAATPARRAVERPWLADPAEAPLAQVFLRYVERSRGPIAARCRRRARFPRADILRAIPR